jgi:antitoxin HigA-1
MKTITDRQGPMHSPSHPGEVLKMMCMEPLNVSVTQVAEAMGVSRKHVSAIVNRRAPVTADTAMRIAGVFDTEPDIWVNMQAQYDLWEARQRVKPKVTRLAA